MNDYSIVRIGNEYVVQAGENRLLKIASRRKATKLVNAAAELLEQQPASPTGEGASISGDPGVIPDPHGIIPDPGVTLDPHGVIPDPARVIPDPAEVP